MAITLYIHTTILYKYIIIIDSLFWPALYPLSNIIFRFVVCYDTKNWHIIKTLNLCWETFCAKHDKRETSRNNGNDEGNGEDPVPSDTPGSSAQHYVDLWGLLDSNVDAQQEVTSATARAVAEVQISVQIMLCLFNCINKFIMFIMWEWLSWIDKISPFIYADILKIHTFRGQRTHWIIGLPTRLFIPTCLKLLCNT